MAYDEHGASIIDHIEELRWRLIKCIGITILLVPIAWPFSQILIDWIVKNLCPPELGSLYYTSPMELFFLRLRFSLIIAFSAGMPAWIWHIWRYLTPGLYKQEIKAIVLAAGGSLFLFLGGIAMGLFGIFPILMRYSLNMQTSEIRPLINVSSCLGLAGWLMLGFGICFQLPVVLLGLIQLGIVRVATLKHLRPYIVIGIFFIAAVLTPPDLISQMAMGIPTWSLYEISLIIGTQIEKTRLKKEQEQDDFNVSLSGQ